MDLNDSPYLQDRFFGTNSHGLIIFKNVEHMLKIDLNSDGRKAYIKAQQELDELNRNYYKSSVHKMPDGEGRIKSGLTLGVFVGFFVFMLTVMSVGTVPLMVTAGLAAGLFGVIGLATLLVKSGQKQAAKRNAAEVEYFKPRAALEKIINAEKARLANELYAKKHPDLAAATVATPAQAIAPSHAQIRTQPRAARINHGMPQP